MRSWMIGFVSGVTGTAFLPFLPDSAVPFFALALILSLASRKYWILAAAGLLFGFSVGTVAGNNLLDRRFPDACIGTPIEVTGTVSSLPTTFLSQDGSEGTRFTLSVETLQPIDCRGPRKLKLSVYQPITIAAGQRWQFVASLKAPRNYANPGNIMASVMGSAGHVLQGLDAIGHAQNAGQPLHETFSSTLRMSHHRIRQSISLAIDRLPLDADVRAILKAISVANKSGISDKVWLAFRDLGLSHLLVISGLHVGMVAALGYLLGAMAALWFARFPAIGTLVPSCTAFMAAFLYAALAGFTLPAQRAVYMLAALLAAKVLARNVSPLDRLLLAAVMVLIVSPLSVAGPGFWLSFVAVSGLFWVSGWGKGGTRDQDKAVTRESRRFLIRLLSGHVYMGLVMLPLGVFFFGGSSTVSALANFAAIPLMGFVVVPLALLGIALHFFSTAAAAFVWMLAGWPLEYFLYVVDRAIESHGSALFAALDYSSLAMTLCVAGVALSCVPGRQLFRWLVLLLLLPLVLPVEEREAADDNDTVVTVMDVGQGTAVLIRSAGRALLYDTGGGNRDGWNFAGRIVIPYARSLRLDSLDSLVVSHRDSDHSAGTQAVLDALQPVRFRYGSGVPFHDHAGLPCIAGETWSWPGGQVFSLLSPGLEEGLNSNNTSCVLRMELNGYRFILAGDIEGVQERALVAYWREDLQTDWLLVPHHGSRTSSSATLLKFAEPEWAVFSSGFANRFGHPHPDVLDRYLMLGTNVLNTAEDGAVEFRLSPEGELSVRQYRNNYRPYWF